MAFKASQDRKTVFAGINAVRHVNLVNLVNDDLVQMSLLTASKAKQ